MNVTPAPRIFVSYARADGREFAFGLRDRIAAAGLAVWQDLADMEGGKDWWEQIAGLLRGSEIEHLILVLTPKAVESEVVRREWRLARQEGVRVTPVVDPTHRPDFGKLPRALGRVNALDPAIDEQWRQLVRILEGPGGQEHVPFVAPDVPPGFIERPKEYDALKKALIDSKGDAVAIIAALWGGPGAGKTTLAAKLVHDDDVQEAFFHGVLWTTLGRTPGDVTAKLNSLTRKLDPVAPLEIDRELAVARWREALAERYCLIVIDDVWRAADLEPFLAGGALCARLITTRNEAVLPRDRSSLTIVPVDAMRAGEGAELLERGFDKAALAPLAQRFQKFAAALGGWPLLLNLAHARIADRVEAGHDLANGLGAVEQAWRSRGIGAFDARNPEQRNEAAATSLDLSVEALAEREGREAAARLEELASFAEDQDIPFWLVLSLWQRTAQLGPLESEDLLVRIRALSFLESYDAPRETFRLHDVVRARLRERAGINRLTGLNRCLAGAIVARAEGNWHQLASDPYALRHLPMHCADGGDAARLEEILGDAGWIEARLEAAIATGEGAAGIVRTYGDYAHGDISRAVARVMTLVGQDLAMDGPSQVISQLLAGATGGPLVEVAKARWRQQLAGNALAPVWPTMVAATSERLRLHVHAAVNCIAFSQDGERLATGSADNTARIWDVATGQELARLEGGPGGGMGGVVFCPDGMRLVTGSGNNAVQIWDLATGEELARFEAHCDGITSIALSLDGNCLATGSWDATARLWDLSSSREIARFNHRERITSVAFSTDGTRLVTGSWDKTAAIWDLPAGAHVVPLEGHEGIVWSVAFSPGGSCVATGSDDGTTRLWDVATGDELKRFNGHGARVNSVAFSADGTRLATGSNDSTARLWDLGSGQEVARLEGHEGAATSVAFSPDGTHLATGSGYDNTARLWELATATDSGPPEGHRGSIISVAFSADGTRLATGSEDHTARLWDLTTGREMSQFEGHRGSVTGVAFVPGGMHLATGSEDSTARLWELGRGGETACLEGHTNKIVSIAVSPEGMRLATGSWDNTVRLWALATGTEIMRLEAFEAQISGVVFTPDGTRLVTGSWDKTARLWDITTAEEIARYEGHLSPVIGIALSLDGTRLVTGSGDNTVRVWDVATATERVRLEIRDHIGITCVALSPDGTRLATGHYDQTLRLWDLSTRQEISWIRLPAPVSQIAYAPTRNLIAAAAGRGRPHLLEIVG